MAVAPPTIRRPQPDQPTREAVKRVVIYPPSLGLFLAIDPTPGAVAAVSRVNLDRAEVGLLGAAYPWLKKLPAAPTRGFFSKVPGDPEPLLLLKPDAVLVWPAFAAPLEKVGLPVVREDDSDPEALAYMIGGMTGQEARAAFLIRYATAEDLKVAHVLADLPPGPIPKVLILWGGSEKWFVVGRGHPLARIFNGLPVTNAAVGIPGGAIDIERLLQINPDVILLPCCGGTQDTPDWFYTQPELASLSAVREHRIYDMPALAEGSPDLLEPPLLRLWLVEVLFPSQFQPRFRYLLCEAYKAIHGCWPTDIVIDSDLFVGANRQSEGYERFFR